MYILAQKLRIDDKFPDDFANWKKQMFIINIDPQKLLSDNIFFFQSKSNKWCVCKSGMKQKLKYSTIYVLVM